VVPVSEPTTDPRDRDPALDATDDVPAGAATDAGPTPAGPTDDAGTDPAALDAGADEAGPTGFGRHPVVLYTLKRIVLLVVVAGGLYLVGLRGVWLILFAFLLSGVIAMVALKDSREGAAYGITHAVKKVNDRIDASSRAEDYDDLDDDLAEPAADEVGPAADPPAQDPRA